MPFEHINVYTVVCAGAVVASNLLSLEEAQAIEGGEIYAQQALLINGEVYL